MKRLFTIIWLASSIIALTCMAVFGQIQPNNSCGSASILTVNPTCVNNTFTMPSSFTNDGYTLTGCNVGNTRDDGWYKFQATSVVTEITIDATQDIIIHVYSGTCGSFTLIGCADNQTTAAEVLNIPTTVGTWYYIRIQRYNSSSGITGGTICLYSTNNCNWTLCLYDSYGDGWNDAYLQVFVNGISIGYVELLSGSSQCYVLPASMSDNVSMVFTGGSWDAECSYIVYNDLGAAYHTENAVPGDYSYVQTCNGSLPIELHSFNVSCNENGRTGIFMTLSEHNVAYYIIQSSSDMMFWNNVQVVYATGNSSTLQNYIWSDTEDYGTQPTIYYQLVEYDNDGYSKIFGIYSSTCNLTSSEINIWPNPAQANGEIHIVGDVTEIKIYDIIGKEVQFKLSDDNTIQGLSSGMYIIIVNGIRTFKLVVN